MGNQTHPVYTKLFHKDIILKTQNIFVAFVWMMFGIMVMNRFTT